MRIPLLFSVLSVGTFVAACATTTSGTSSSDGTSATDLQLARTSYGLIAGPTGKCTACHTAGKDDIRGWGSSLQAIDAQCLDTSLALTAQQRVDCLKDPETQAFTASRLGLYASGVGQPLFEDLFKAAYGADAYAAPYAAFKKLAGMPASGRPSFDASGFATIKTWAEKGEPNLDDVINTPGATDCVPGTTPDLSAHIASMATEGWGARLADASTPMARCGSATAAADCLTSLTDLTPTWGAAGTTQTLRQLRALTGRSSYWVRSSADGRYAAFGGSPSKIVDLESDTTQITVSAPYDPGFFPNNDGFSFAGTTQGISVCRQSVLLNAFATTHNVTFTEAGCTHVIDTVYQSIGASLDGSLYFMATGSHTNDAGGSSGPLSADFGDTATTTLTPMFNDGTKYVPGANVLVSVPNEGDQQLSPSNKLLITRFGQSGNTAGYHLRMLTPTITPAAAGAQPTVKVDSKIVGTVCIAGGKGQMSFNERFLAVHQYTATTSDIYVDDLKTGDKIRVTNMAAGQHALYPHFRADGWLYFLVRDGNTGKETLVASDVSLHRP